MSAAARARWPWALPALGLPLGCGCPLAGLAGADSGLGPLRLGGLLGLDFGGGVVGPGGGCPLLTWARDATSTRADQLDGLLGRDGLPGLGGSVRLGGGGWLPGGRSLGGGAHAAQQDNGQHGDAG